MPRLAKRAKHRTRSKVRPKISIVIALDDVQWKRRPAAVALLKRAARGAARLGVKRQRALTFTILLTGDKRSKSLNTDFRGLRKPTNVLSFPAAAKTYLGDVAIAYGVVTREARAQKKTFSAHAAHLAAHGVLHLLGYDHFTDRDAEKMEGLELRALAAVGIDDPYAAERES